MFYSVLLLFGLFFTKELRRALSLQKHAQFHTSLMKLRLGRANAATHHARDLFVLVAFYVMKHKGRTIARRQLRNGIIQSYAVNDRHSVRVLRAKLYAVGRLLVIRASFIAHL